jgi:large subunit ribosomal protein L2
MKKFFKRIKKNLSILFKKKGGRNNHGIITIRHRGGGFKRRHYNLDF